jgi:hypothetical protein
VVFLLVDFAAGEALVQDADRVVTLAGPAEAGALLIRFLEQDGLALLIFLLVDLAAGEALVQDAECVVGPNSLRRDSNRPRARATRPTRSERRRKPDRR